MIFENYKLAKKEANKAVKEARANVYQDLYDRLDSKDGEYNIYRIAQMKEKKTKDLGTIRCIKNYNHKVLVRMMILKKDGGNILISSSMIIMLKMLVI